MVFWSSGLLLVQWFLGAGPGREEGEESAREARPEAREEEAAGGEEQASGGAAGRGEKATTKEQNREKQAKKQKIQYQSLSDPHETFRIRRPHPTSTRPPVQAFYPLSHYPPKFIPNRFIGCI